MDHQSIIVNFWHRQIELNLFLPKMLIGAAKKGLELGDISVLKRYEKLRGNENLKMMTVKDLFYRVFSNEVLPVKFYAIWVWD